jgi:hypothetical protein
LSGRIALDAQITEVAREIAYREGVYPQFVARGIKSQEEADAQIAAMKAAHASLVWLHAHRERILALAPELKEGR